MIENDVYYEPGNDWCWYCPDNQPEEGVRVFLCNAGHSPCNGEANYICEVHLDSNVVKYINVDPDDKIENWSRDLFQIGVNSHD